MRRLRRSGVTFEECSRLLLQHDDYLLLTHNNPDGDTVMSAAALCRALRRKNKRAYLFPNPQLTAKQRLFVEKLLAPESFRPGFVVAVDIATEQLFPSGWQDWSGRRASEKGAGSTAGKVDLCIDHHPSNSHYSSQELIDAGRSSCGEIVQQLILQMTGKLTKNEATLLYIALTTDTGAFQYANVNEKTYCSAAELMRFGAEHSSVMVSFFRKTSLSRLRLEGLIYTGLHIHRNGKLVVATVTREMMERVGATEDDCDDLAGLSGRAEGALMNVTIRETPDGGSKVSVRSAPGISSAAVCAALGGGGHELAAGCTVQLPPAAAETLLLDVIDAVCGDSL